MLRPGLTQGKVACGQWCRAAGSLRDLNERVSAPGENAWDDLKTVDPSSQSWVPADTQTWRLKKKNQSNQFIVGIMFRGESVALCRLLVAGIHDIHDRQGSMDHNLPHRQDGGIRRAPSASPRRTR